MESSVERQFTEISVDLDADEALNSRAYVSVKSFFDISCLLPETRE